jgi:deoxyhypusine synthase
MYYIGSPFVDDNLLRTMHIDRIYDTFIDEDQLTSDTLCTKDIIQAGNASSVANYLVMDSTTSTVDSASIISAAFITSASALFC